MRLWISRVVYGASNHIISLTKKSFRKKISICQIFTAPKKCPPRREKEAPEDESGLNGFTLLASTHWESHFPSLKEKQNHLGDLGFAKSRLSVRKRV